MLLKNLKINQAIAACIATLGGFGFGLGLSWTATTLPSYDETGQIGNLTATEKSWIASLLTIGALIACPITGMLVNVVGRKTCLICLTLIGFPGWVLLTIATKPEYLYVGRILIGMSTGGSTSVVPIYISEIASKENRGVLGSLFLVQLCLGKLFSNGVGILFPAHITSLLSSFHPLVYGLLLILIPESPLFLVQKGRVQEAQNALKWLTREHSNLPCGTVRQTCKDPELIAKLENLKPTAVSSEMKKEFSWRECLTSTELLTPSMTVFVLMLLAQFCGINVTTFYTVEIFQLSGDMIVDSKSATVILALIQTIGCIPASIFVDKYGRKLLLSSSFLAMTISLASFAGYFYIQDKHHSLLETYTPLGLIPLISLVIYSLAYSWGVGSIVWIIMSEILPPKIIGPASAVANILFWGSAFIVTQAFQMFKMHIALYIWFATFSLVCIFGFIFILISLPETKGLSIQEIQAFYSKARHMP